MASPDSDAAPNEPKNFSDIVEAAKRSAQDKDYDISQFGDPVKKEGRLMAKYKRIRNVVFGDQGVTQKFFMGFKMGFAVGGIFGGLTGLITAMKSRNWLYFPLMAGVSGMSFGFFLGVGTIVRSAEHVSFPTHDLKVEMKNGKWVVVRSPIWE